MKNLFKALSSNGDGTGTVNAIGDYSVTPLNLKYTGEIDKVGLINRMIVQIVDGNGFSVSNYGALPALTNGVVVSVKDANDNVINSLTAYPVLSNGDWGAQCYDAQYQSYGVGDDTLLVRWTFGNSGKPLEIDFRKGEYLDVELNDNFTGLTLHRFKIDGVFKSFTY